MKKSPTVMLLALVFTSVILSLSYLAFGPWTSLIFSSGFLGGYLVWVFVPNNPVSFISIRAPYWITLAFFIFLHKVEENIFKFQEELSKLTGTAVPELTSPSLILLLIASVGAWLLIPILMKRNYAFGYYLAWTFFAAMGITELTHFIFPFVKPEPYSYFPGMVSVLFLAPAAWWGMLRLLRKPH